jgi:hypothetical protein
MRSRRADLQAALCFAIPALLSELNSGVNSGINSKVARGYKQKLQRIQIKLSVKK